MEIFANVPALVKHPGTDLTWESVIEPSKLSAYVPDINSADALGAMLLCTQFMNCRAENQFSILQPVTRCLIIHCYVRCHPQI